jgi:hypothetical protein
MSNGKFGNSSRFSSGYAEVGIWKANMFTAIQGVGAGGINVLIEIIVCDLLPLRERGKYLGVMFGFVALGTALGPLFGGLIVQNVSWRWIFYLNLPVGGVALIALVTLLKVRSDETTSLITRMKRVDWTGNAIFTLAMVSLLIALSWAGSKYPWSSFQVLVPLIVGFLGFGLFLLFESSRFCAEPTMPIHLFSNRTSAIALVLTFLHSVATVSVIYFMPVYFQGVLGTNPGRAGTDLLPTILLLIPFAIIAGGTLSKFGRYRPLHHAGFALMIIGFGVLGLLDADSSTAEWVVYQCISAAGAGLILPVLLPAFQVSLAEADTGLSTSTWAFVRSFGQIWGATIPAAVFNNRFAKLSYRITDPVAYAALSNGSAYEHATMAFLDTVPDQIVRRQIIDVFADSLQTVWHVSIAFAALGFLLVIIEKEIPLRKELETNFGLKEKESTRPDQPPSELVVDEANQSALEDRTYLGSNTGLSTAGGVKDDLSCSYYSVLNELS